MFDWLYRTEFLYFYGGIMLACIFIFRWIRANAEAVQGKKDLTKKPNSYEVAYMKDGIKEVARAVLINLIEKKKSSN